MYFYLVGVTHAQQRQRQSFGAHAHTHTPAFSCNGDPRALAVVSYTFVCFHSQIS